MLLHFTVFICVSFPIFILHGLHTLTRPIPPKSHAFRAYPKVYALDMLPGSPRLIRQVHSDRLAPRAYWAMYEFCKTPPVRITVIHGENVVMPLLYKPGQNFREFLPPLLGKVLDFQSPSYFARSLVTGMAL